MSNFFSLDVSNLGFWALIECSFVAIFLGVVMALVHKYTSRYNKSFLITISVLPLLVESVILMVNGNLGTSIATLGAFSLIRFRSIPGTSKEILIVFFAMAVGLACGMGQLGFAIIVTIIGCLAIFVFNAIKLFNPRENEKILKITIPENLDYTDIFSEEFKKYTKFVELEQVKTTNMGSLFELSYKVVLNNCINEKEFIDDLRIKNGNLKIMLSQAIQSNYDL